MDNLPRDPLMLVSVLNMKLRDFYADLDALCDDLDVSRAELEESAARAGYHYDKALRAFIK